MKSMTRPILVLILFAMAIAGCGREEECPPDTPAEVDNRDRFTGTYAVHDTLGVYLYSMTVAKFNSGGRDSMLILNYADTFDLRILHERYWTSNVLDIGVHFPAFDQAGHRWALFDGSAENGFNRLINDTIRLRFTMSNIVFYFEDGVPYFSCDCRQIAVKQP